jgi:hypothetical protein
VVTIPYTLWFAVAWSAAINGVFRTAASPLRVPLLPLAIFLPVIIGAPLLLLSKRVGQMLDAMQMTWLVAPQRYRVFGSVFLAVGLRGLPGVFAVPAGIGDVLIGLFAVPAAIAVATGTTQGRRAAITWNIFGLADFAVAMTLGLITSPGPFQLIVPNVPSIGAGAYPNVLTPAFGCAGCWGTGRSTGNRTFRLSAVAVEPDDIGVLGCGVRRQLGLIAGAVLAGSLSD